MRIALAQLDQTLGDLTGNARSIVEAIDRAAGAGASLVVTPELSLCGYPPEDLLLRPAFIDACATELAALAARTRACAAMVGFPERADGHRHNAVALLREGRIERIYRKERLPN
ncbi:MAG: nitrilase-related carbon-nitrogen hydrolase, partial [Casimicrobiaceae bacterium]